MSTCVLCLDVYGRGLHAEANGQHFEIFSQNGLQQQMCKIIRKHFWIQLEKDKDADAVLCDKCWEVLKMFHEFYEKIVKVHAVLKNISIDPPPDPLPSDELQILQTEIIDINMDPLPPDKMELDNDENTDILAIESVKMKNDLLLDTDAAPTNFFDEVKVEVDDLELLPQAEIIDDDDVRKYFTTPSGSDDDSECKESEKCQPAPDDDSECKESEECQPAPDDDSECKESEECQPASDDDSECKESEKCQPAPAKRPRGRPKRGTGNKKTVRNEEYNRCTRNSVKDDSKYLPGDDLSLRKTPRIRNPNPVRMTSEERQLKIEKQQEFDLAIKKMFDKLHCYICNKPSKNFDKMREHFRAEHDEHTLYIICCGRKFNTRKLLAEHVFLHFNPEHFKCRICETLFQDGHSLEAHEQAHRENFVVREKKIFQCEKCPRHFSKNASLQHHIFTKHVPSSELQFSCSECNKKLPTERKLRNHMKIKHDPESTFICDKCGKRLPSQLRLRKHHLIEHCDVPKPDPEPVQCDLCGTWYRELAGLRQHIKRIHQDDIGEFRCNICNKISTTARTHKRHMNYNHLCERKFKCTMCEKAFKRPQDLREHTSTHTGEVLYTCPNCPMTFFCSANMYKHRQRIHPVEYEADRNILRSLPTRPKRKREAITATAANKIQQVNSDVLVQTQEN